MFFSLTKVSTLKLNSAQNENWEQIKTLIGFSSSFALSGYFPSRGGSANTTSYHPIERGRLWLRLIQNTNLKLNTRQKYKYMSYDVKRVGVGVVGLLCQFKQWWWFFAENEKNEEGRSGVSRCPERAPLTLQASICFASDDEDEDWTNCPANRPFNQKLVKYGKTCQKLHLPTVGKSYQKHWQQLPKVANSLEKLTKVVESCHKLLKMPNVANSCQKLSKVAKKLAKVVTTKSCKKMHLPTVGNSYQKNWQELPKVANTYQQVSKIATS